MMHVWTTVMVLLGANKTFIFASFGQLCINAIVFFFWPELAFFQSKTDNHCVAVFASEWEFRQVKTLPELHDCCTCGGPDWMYILLKTGFSTVLKLTYIQESLKMHGIYAEGQYSTRILYAAWSEIRSHRDFTPIFSTFPNCIHTAKFEVL